MEKRNQLLFYYKTKYHKALTIASSYCDSHDLKKKANGQSFQIAKAIRGNCHRFNNGLSIYNYLSSLIPSQRFYFWESLFKDRAF